MKCGNCTKPVELGRSVIVTFQTSGPAGRQVRIHFCNVQCCWWGGQKYARSTNPGAPTTLRTFRALYPGAVE